MLLINIAAALGCGPLIYFCSCAIYGVFLHPLAKYPGPWLAKVSHAYNFYHAYKGDLHLDILRCHQKYGKIVRYAPNRLLILSSEALKDVYGHSKGLAKSDAYSPHPYYPDTPNLFACVDKTLFARKKRFMNQALTENLLKGVEDDMLSHIQNFRDVVMEGAEQDCCQRGPPRDMAEWTYYFTLDVVSSLSFGRSLGLLTDPSRRWIVPALTDGNRYMYLEFAWPSVLKSKLAYWVRPSKLFFHQMGREGEEFVRLASQFRDERKISASTGENVAAGESVASFLETAVDPKTKMRLSEDEIWTEVLTLVRAGGDTVSTALAAGLFYLSRNHEAYTRLASEIHRTFPTLDSIRQGPALSSCVYLRACLNEAMRLSPPAPGSFWRQALPETGDGGALIDGVPVPSGCEVGVGLYALNHNEEYFPDAWAFRPERFLPPENNTDPSSSSDIALRTNTAAYAPFLLGPRTCPARSMAYLEMSLFFAYLLWDLDFAAVGDEQGQGRKGLGWGRAREEEFQLWDIFSTDKHGPVLRFAKRGTIHCAEKEGRAECAHTVAKGEDGVHSSCQFPDEVR